MRYYYLIDKLKIVNTVEVECRPDQFPPKYKWDMLKHEQDLEMAKKGANGSPLINLEKVGDLETYLLVRGQQG